MLAIGGITGALGKAAAPAVAGLLARSTRSFAELIQGLLEGDRAASIAVASPPQDETETLRAALLEQLERTTGTANLELVVPVTLELDFYNDVRVVGAHPQREAIEQLFADHPDLADSFRRLVHTVRQQRSTEAGFELGVAVQVQYSSDGVTLPSVPA